MFATFVAAVMITTHLDEFLGKVKGTAMSSRTSIAHSGPSNASDSLPGRPLPTRFPALVALLLA
jgi:hypothetical protein